MLAVFKADAPREIKFALDDLERDLGIYIAALVPYIPPGESFPLNIFSRTVRSEIVIEYYLEGSRRLTLVI